MTGYLPSQSSGITNRLDYPKWRRWKFHELPQRPRLHLNGFNTRSLHFIGHCIDCGLLHLTFLHRDTGSASSLTVRNLRNAETIQKPG